MSRVRGRSFKITKNQAKGYGYAKFRRNPGVTTIAAINGRGSYGASRSARSVMGKLKQNARKPVARKRLTAAQKSEFKRRMDAGRMSANRSTSRKQSATSRKNIKKAQTARRAWGQKLKRGKRVRVGRAAYGSRPKAKRLSAGVYIANRRKKAGKKTMARRRRKTSLKVRKKARRSTKRRRKTSLKTSAPKRRRRRKAAKKGAARKRSTARKTVRRRRRRLKANAAPKRRRRRKSRKAAAVAPKRRRRRSKARRGTKRRRVSRKRRGTARRRTRKVSRRRRGRKGRRLKANGRRRRVRRNGRKLKANSRRRSGKRRSHKANRRRRGHRRNGRKLFRMNGVGSVLKTGAVLFGGFALHRLLTNLVDKKLLTRLLPAPAPVATSGFSLSDNRGLIASLAVGAISAVAVNKLVKNQDTKKLLIGGIVASAMHGVVLSVLKQLVPAQADMLSGPEDGRAARLAAMYGLGAGASIMPRYQPINGLGEYFREPMNGLGEYFREPMNGVGEYLAATNGLGTYEPNGDLYQAAAGFGSHDYSGNHIDPSADLDRQLTIAEAAAGVGSVQPFEAAAGVMQAAAGFGNVSSVPSADTWIPGTSDGQLWAGVRPVTNPQSATELLPAGSLQTEGGQGIFG